MPIYSYQCTENSKHTWDEIRHVSEKDDRAECAKCECPAERLVTASGAVKGNFGTVPKKGSKPATQLDFDFNKKE